MQEHYLARLQRVRWPQTLHGGCAIIVLGRLSTSAVASKRQVWERVVFRLQGTQPN